MNLAIHRHVRRHADTGAVTIELVVSETGPLYLGLHAPVAAAPANINQHAKELEARVIVANNA